ncbi:MAG: S8 family serine peptidase [Candidatus Peribacteria bacterium]|nr:S8 family serine peptidase [Candidatus Peribacteria bacterium]
MKKFLYRTMIGLLITQQYGTSLLWADFENETPPTEEENILNEGLDDKSIEEDSIDEDVSSPTTPEPILSNMETEEAPTDSSHEPLEGEYVEGEVLVKYKDGADLSTLAVIEGENGETTEELIDLLSQDPNVEYVQPNFLYHTFAFSTNDPDYPNNLRGLGNIKRGETMEVFSGRAHTTGSIVAVIDLGVDYRHPEFTGQMRNGSACKTYTGATWNGCQYGASIFLSGAFFSGGSVYGWLTANKTPLPLDTARNPNNTGETLTNLAGYNIHGTHVAGTIGAKMNNGIGIVGVNPSSEIMAIRAGYNTSANNEFLTTNAIINSIAFAKHNGAKIINASRGGGGIGDTALSTAISDFTTAGGIFIAAAGNSENDNNSSPTYPCNFNQSNPSIICVAAHDSYNTLAYFSNYGNVVDISAPGVSIKSTIESDGYSNMNGTSMATPHVAGAFSLLWSYRPDLTGGQIKSALLNGADTNLQPYSSRTIKGNKKLNLYRSLQLLDTIAPTLTGTVNTGEYCSTETLTYTFTGSDDLALAEEGIRYSFDGGTTRTGATTLITGTTSLTVLAQDWVGNTGSLTITATTPNCSTLLTPTFILPTYVSGSAVNGVLTLNLQAEYAISGDITEILTGEGQGNISLPLSLSGTDGLKTLVRSARTGDKSFSGEVKIFLDTTAPIVFVSYSPTTSTPGPVQATLTLNET